MSDFPKGGGIEATRAWLDKEGFTGLFTGWKADALFGKDDRFIKSKFVQDAEEQEKAEMLCGLLNTARNQTQGQFSPFAFISLSLSLSLSLCTFCIEGRPGKRIFIVYCCCFYD
jgi:hypothetical protein